MTTKFPAEVEKFATLYFAAEAQATRYQNGMLFRSVDKSKIARELKVFMDSTAFESLFRLCADLAKFQPGITGPGHDIRLRKIAKAFDIPIRPAVVPEGASVSPTTVAASSKSIPSTFRSELQEVFLRALRSGISMFTLNTQASQILTETHEKEQATVATSRLTALLRETGLTRDQLLKIATTI